MNASLITLTPKEKWSKFWIRYLPISLCNVIYKIFSKVIENSLKPLLSIPIYEEQEGYMERWPILDNLFEAHEIIHSLKSKNKTGMVMQMDIDKSYDRMSWEYIEHTLQDFGFNKIWIQWVISLVTTPIFSSMLNGSLARLFSPIRGLR